MSDDYSQTLKGLKFYSGGAKGADTLWKQAVQNYGATCVDYTPAFYDSLSPEIKEKLEEQYLEVVDRLHRRVLSVDTYAGKLVRRDMLQANKAKQVIAISYIDQKLQLVKGGTGYCTTRAIIRQIPLFVFDQADHLWYEYEYEFSEFNQIPPDCAPILKDKTTLVGSRDLTEEGKREIGRIVNNTCFDLIHA